MGRGSGSRCVRGASSGDAGRAGRASWTPRTVAVGAMRCDAALRVQVRRRHRRCERRSHQARLRAQGRKVLLGATSRRCERCFETLSESGRRDDLRQRPHGRGEPCGQLEARHSLECAARFGSPEKKMKIAGFLSVLKKCNRANNDERKCAREWRSAVDSRRHITASPFVKTIPSKNGLG